MYRMVLFLSVWRRRQPGQLDQARAATWKPQAQSVGHRADGDAGDVHGGAGHLHRQRVAAAHCGIAGREPGRGDVGDQLVPGGERRDPADQRIPGDAHRAQALLHDLRGDVRRELAAVRACAIAAACCSSSACCRGSAAEDWRPQEQAILADTFEPKKRGQAFALYGLAVVTAPAIGPTGGRMDHGQLSVALDLFHQRAGGADFDVPDEPRGGGSAAPDRSGEEGARRA